MKIVVASYNPVKVTAVNKGFQRMFPDLQFEIQMVSVASQVNDQPFSNQEALQGAINRANNAIAAFPQADFWVGIEGGVEEQDGGEMAAFAWVVIRNRHLIGKGRTGTFFLPSRVAELIRQGKELGEADDLVFGKTNSKQENGAIGILTGDVIDRAQLYEHAVILALVPFKNPDLYSPF